MKRENRLVLYLLSLTWGAIMTIIGFVVALILITFMAKSIRISFYRGRMIIHFKYRSFGGAGLGLVIISSGREGNYTLLDHEIGHSIQNCWYGPLFIFLVAIPSAIRYQMWDYLDKKYRSKYGIPKDYDSIWFEKQATELGGYYF